MIFADRNGILFEWNEVVDECPEGIVEEDVVLYPSLVAKFLGVTLGRDHPIQTIEEDIMPQGRNKAAAAHNANMEPFAAAGVDAPTIIHTNINEINETDDDNDRIISIADIPAQANHYPLNVPDTLDKDDGGKDDKDDDKEDDAPQEKTHQMSREGNRKERKFQEWKTKLQERKLQEWKTKLQECADHSAKAKE